jgi:hypothetical protein
VYSEFCVSALIMAIIYNIRTRELFLRTQAPSYIYILLLCMLSSIAGLSLAINPDYSIAIICLIGIVNSELFTNEKHLLFFGGCLILYLSLKLGFGYLASGIALAFGYTIYIITEKNEE